MAGIFPAPQPGKGCYFCLFEKLTLMPTPKIALVTGGSRGLGRNMALSLAHKGIDVILTYRTNKAEAQKTVQEIEAAGQKAAALQLDLIQFHSLDNFVTEVKNTLAQNWNVHSLDFLINNGGIGAIIPFLETNEEVFDNLMHVHFKSVFFLTQKLVPFMNKGGCIINISTATTRYCLPGYSVYAPVKAALEVFTRYLAKELGTKGIRANAVAPGPVETDFNNGVIRDNPQLNERLRGMTALERVGQVDDIGGVVAFLCTEEGRWINGQRIEVSGGISL